MSAKLKGFIEVPVRGGRIVYLRLSSIDAVFVGTADTLIQLNGCPDADDAFHTSLTVAGVIALMAAAQNG